MPTDMHPERKKSEPVLPTHALSRQKQKKLMSDDLVEPPTSSLN
jgi:hypothetical protein